MGDSHPADTTGNKKKNKDKGEEEW